MLRSNSRFARPRLGCLLVRFDVGIPLSPLASACRNNAPLKTVRAAIPVGVDYRQILPLDNADRNQPSLAVVTPRVFTLKSQALENQSCEFEIEVATLEITLTFSLIPSEAHCEYTVVYTDRASCIAVLYG
jgi:hypothetical protein